MSEEKATQQAVNEELDRMFAVSIALEEAEGGDSLFFKQDFEQFAEQHERDYQAQVSKIIFYKVVHSCCFSCVVVSMFREAS